MGVAAVTWTSIRGARDVVAAASRTEAVSREAVALASLDTAVFDEMVWSAVNSVVNSFGGPGGDLAPLIGADPVAELAAKQARTDEMMTAVDLPAASAALEAARADGLDFKTVLAAFADVAATVEAPLGVALDTTAAAARGSAAAGDLDDDLSVLRLAVDLRSELAGEFYGYFASIFDVRDTPAAEIAGLIDLRARYDDTLAALREAGDRAGTPGLVAALSPITDESAVLGMTSEIDALIARSFTTGVPAVGGQLDIPTLAQNVSGFTAVLMSMDASSNAMLEVLDRAIDGVLTASSDVRAVADLDIDHAYARAAAFVLVSLLTAVLASGFIVRPLRSLRRAAETLQTNQELHAGEAISGPAEVRAANQAIRDAAAHFELVTRQARALATGALDAPVLDEAAPGGLGVALQHAVGTLRTALAQQDEFRRRLAHEAAHDGLTQLANRTASMAQLTRSLARTTRSGGQLAVLFIDLDRFKDVNDGLGHQTGDAVLVEVAQRLVTCVREGDHVGRLGGDEFVVIAEPVDGIDDAVGLGERILARLSEPIELPTERVTIGASIGIALADGNALTADELLRDADLAVYRAKEVGRGGIEICDEDLRNDLAETLDLTAAIRAAIAHDELIVYYQPIIDTSSEELHALEALVRWQRPGHDTLVPPDEFIGFAERSSLIIDVDKWVLDAVARQMAVWQDDPRYQGVPVAVNVSGRHLTDDHFVDHVLEPLGRYGIDPRGLIIEVTESALLDDLAAAAVKLQQLRDHGILVSIDDFGTGYTSLAHLRSLPVDILKIDRSFSANAARNPHEASIVKLIIDTGHLLGATITAEGIETVAEATKLTGLGSDNLQGFYFARPQPPDRLTMSIDRGAVSTD
jgi:diguanylate cyclase (GGDEF)-like protein